MDVGTALTFVGSDFYHIRKYGHPEYRSLYKNNTDKIYPHASDLFSNGKTLFFNAYGASKCFAYEESQLRTISESFILNGKVGNRFVSTTDNPYRNEIRNESFELLLSIGKKSLLHCIDSNQTFLLSNLYAVMTDPQEESFVECCDENGESLWVYKFSALSKYDIRHLSADKQIKLNNFVGATQDILVFATNNDWLVGLDAKTGREIWVLKGIPEVEIEGLTGQGSVWCASHFKIDKNQFIYAYRSNIYIEVDPKTGTVSKVINQFKSLPDYGFSDPYLQADFPPVVKIGDILYYTGTHREPIKQENRLGANLRIVSINTKDGSVVDEFEFKRKDGNAIGGFLDVQYADEKLYCLGARNNTLYELSLT